MTLITIFWIFLGLIAYSYFGYTVLLVLLNIIILPFKRKKNALIETLPDVTLLIASYNELDSIENKVNNNRLINYPSEKLKIVWITDGSDDGSFEMLNKIEGHRVIHMETREGKTRALNRGMQFVDTPYVIFTDANTMINKDAVRNIIKEFSDAKTGCVSGEKRVQLKKADNAVASGEGIYWIYESLIKRLESGICSSIGSAGELFGIRTELFEPLSRETINDDFNISLQVIRRGYKIKYCPEAYAIEKPSLNIAEERKRKIRIASGGIQTLVNSIDILNPFRYGFFSFQFFSHKVLRWIIVPFAFIIIYLTNCVIVSINYPEKDIYSILLIIQTLFWFMVIPGRLMQGRNIRLKVLFIPYYLWLVNSSGIIGILRYIRGKSNSIWEKSRRMI